MCASLGAVRSTKHRPGRRRPLPGAGTSASSCRRPRCQTPGPGAPQIFLALGGKTLIIRGHREGETPVPARPIQPFARFSSHNAWGTDHFGFLYHGDLRAFHDELRAKGVQFPVELKQGNGGHLLCYVAAPDGVSIELVEA